MTKTTMKPTPLVRLVRTGSRRLALVLVTLLAARSSNAATI